MTAIISDYPVQLWTDLAKERRADPQGRVLNVVLHGKLTPSRAEALARESGWPPFAGTPEPRLFNPMFEPAWTLAMAADWIVRRTPEAVRERWADYVQECWDWCPSMHRFPSRRHPGRVQEVNGFELKQRAVCTAGDVLERAQFEVAVGAKFAVVPEEARRQLIEALTGGKIIAYAGTELEPIPMHVWLGVSPFRSPVRRGPPDAVYGADLGAPRFFNVRVFRDAVNALWPSEPARPAKAARGRPKGSGSLKEHDAPLVQEIMDRVTAGENRKMVFNDVASRAAGAGDIVSKLKRLEKRVSVAKRRN